MVFGYLTLATKSANKLQLILANKNRFGRSSEKMEDTQQMPFIEVDGTLVFLMKQKRFVIWTLQNLKLWKQLPDAVARRYRFIPAKVEVDEHHVGVYASKTDGHMIKAKHPKSLLHGSPVSASLAAAVMNGKYVNAVPLYRLEQEFIRYGLSITRQNIAN